MKIILIATVLLGEVLALSGREPAAVASVMLTVQEADKIEYVNELLNLEDFPCNPYPGMLFYYTERGNLICGEPEPN